jgi:hypothetical protein
MQYPKSITSTEISRKLELPYKTAYYLKRRIQIFFTLLNEKLQKQMYQELSEYNEKNPIKLPKNGDLREVLQNEPVAVADSVVLYSSSLRANKHRSRRYKTGTSSIYLSNTLGGEQKGVLVHTVGINHGMTFYKSIPLNNQNFLGSDLDEKIPKNTILFTDEGYSFLWDRMNHRMVNHSKRSSDPRYNLSRERWITKEGVSSNGAEARNNLLKQSFRSYNYISPKWSQLYLDELAFLGNVRFCEPLKKVLFGQNADSELVALGDKDYSRCNKNNYVYTPLTLEERKLESKTFLMNNIDSEKLENLPKDLREAINTNNTFWSQSSIENHKRRTESKYNLLARKLWVLLELKKWTSLDHLVQISGYKRLEVLFILKKWLIIGLIKMSKTKERYLDIYRIYKKSNHLYFLLYTESKNEIKRNWNTYNRKLIKSKIYKGRRKYGR